MDANAIRLQNYNALMREFRDRPEEANLPKHGLLRRFGAHAGLSSAYLSQINVGHKNIGDTTARRMEKAFGRPHGWLDNDHSKEDTQARTSAEQEFLAIALRMYRKDPIALQALLMRHLAPA